MAWPPGAHTVQYNVRINEGPNETSFSLAVARNTTTNTDVVHDLLADAMKKFRDDLSGLYPDDVIASNRLYSGDMDGEPWPVP
ncbi:hypothetical protein [Streptomyces phaeochromogenes]|uniref:hypothetical protein n=1 Tax=Streptomyces phaeochromogenes TaxID=1923 RepID=UPI002DDC64C6|nr:hypothetical protein [Streptomyces phaeochromogenes]WRZ31330.1 hypothetical protein OG931_28100 [Streptomyces phaeochromogenes]